MSLSLSVSTTFERWCDDFFTCRAIKAEVVVFGVNAALQLARLPRDCGRTILLEIFLISLNTVLSSACTWAPASASKLLRSVKFRIRHLLRLSSRFCHFNLKFPLSLFGNDLATVNLTWRKLLSKAKFEKQQHHQFVCVRACVHACIYSGYYFLAVFVGLLRLKAVRDV